MLYSRVLYLNAFVWLVFFFLVAHKAKLNPRITVVSVAQHLWADKIQLCERDEPDKSGAIFCLYY